MWACDELRRFSFYRFLNLAYENGYGNGHYAIFFVTPSISVNEKFWVDDNLDSIKEKNVKEMLKYVMLLRVTEVPCTLVKVQ